MRLKLRFYKLRKIPSLVDFHSLFQLLHSQVYCNGLILRRFVFINEEESSRKLLKMSPGKNLQLTPKKLHTLI